MEENKKLFTSQELEANVHSEDNNFRTKNLQLLLNIFRFST